MSKPYRLIRHFIDKHIIRLNLTNYASAITRKIKPDIPKRTFLDSVQAVELLNVCKSPREYAMMMIFLNNGLRVSELINIKLEDYEYIKAYIEYSSIHKDKIYKYEKKIKEMYNIKEIISNVENQFNKHSHAGR